MKQLIKLEDGVVFEVEGPGGNVGLAAATGEAQSVRGKLDDAFATLRQFAARFGRDFADFSEQVEVTEASITLNMGVTAKGNFFVAQGEATSSLEVTITVKPREVKAP